MPPQYPYLVRICNDVYVDIPHYRTVCSCRYIISICYLYVSDAFTATIKMFIIAFLSEVWMLYFASGIGFLDSTSTTVMRSMIIGLVPVSEIGKVFCIVEFMKGILSFCGPIIYGKLYYYTVETTPQAFLYLSSSLKCLVFACSIVLYILLTKRDSRIKKEKYSHKKDDTLKDNTETQVQNEAMDIDTVGSQEPSKSAINLLSKYNNE